jgi:hypothetical protein
MHGEQITIVDQNVNAEEKGKLATQIKMRGCRQESLFINSIKEWFKLLESTKGSVIMTIIYLIEGLATIMQAIAALACSYGYSGACKTSVYIGYFLTFLAVNHATFEILANCLPHTFMLFFTTAIDKMFQVNNPNNNFFLGNTLIQFAFLHLKKNFDQQIKKNNTAILSCSNVIDTYNGGKGSLETLLTNTENKIKENLYNKNTLYTNIDNQKNNLMYINVGALDPYSDNNVPDLDPLNKPAILAEIMNISDEQKTRMENLSKVQFKDCADYDKYNIVDSALLDIQKIFNVETNNFTFLNMLFCKLFDMQPPSMSDIQSINWWGWFIYWKILGFDYKKLTKKIIAPLVKFIFPRKKLRSFILTNLFGNSSPKDINDSNKVSVNFNIMRDLINESIDRIIQNSIDPHSNQIDDSKLEDNIDNEFTNIVTDFIDAIWSAIYAFFQKVGGNVPPFDFGAYEKYNTKCKGKNSHRNKDDYSIAPDEFSLLGK